MILNLSSIAKNGCNRNVFYLPLFVTNDITRSTFYDGIKSNIIMEFVFVINIFEDLFESFRINHEYLHHCCALRNFLLLKHQHHHYLIIEIIDNVVSFQSNFAWCISCVFLLFSANSLKI